MKDPFSEILDAERFERRLQELARLSPREKRRAFKATFVREKRYAEDHELIDREILRGREWADDAARDENYNRDQPI